jgi:hypothetical protein
MPAEAWVALGVGIVTILGTFIWTVWALGGKLASAATRFELIGAQQTNEIKEIKIAVDELKAVLSVVAVQKDQIQTIRDVQTQNTMRTDNTFNRIFAILDGMRVHAPPA